LHFATGGSDAVPELDFLIYLDLAIQKTKWNQSALIYFKVREIKLGWPF